MSTPENLPVANEIPLTNQTPVTNRTPVDRSGRRRWLQLPLGIILFLVAEGVMMAVAVIGTLLTGGNTAEGVAPWALLIGACVGAVVAIGGFLVIVGPIGRSPGVSLKGRGKLPELLIGLVVGTVLMSLSVGVIALLGGYQVTGLSASPQLLEPLAIGIGAGFIEEILFRGILLRLLDAWMGSWAALAITSLLFGLMHMTNEGASVATALGLVIEAGVLLGGAYLLTRRLWLVIGIHIAWNTVQSGVFSSTVSGTGQQSGILTAQMDGPAWLTGGSMGIEGSVVTVIVGLVAGIVMLVLARRRGHLLPSVRTEARRNGGRGLGGSGTLSADAVAAGSAPADR